MVCVCGVYRIWKLDVSPKHFVQYYLSGNAQSAAAERCKFSGKYFELV